MSTMVGVSSLEMTMACVKCMCIPWKGSGHSCAVGCDRIGAFPKSNSRSTWGSSRSCTMSASEAKRCCLRSLSCWSRKTLESNKSVPLLRGGRHLLARLALRRLSLLRKLVRCVVLVDVAHVCRGLDPDPLGRDDLDVVEPLVGVEPAPLGFRAELREVPWPRVIGREREQRAGGLVELRIGEVTGHELIHVLRAGVNVRLDRPDVADAHLVLVAGMSCITPMAPTRL